jgi:undecaprenyl phosphate-alpha-L-ara4N flippase subunit ArnE
MKIALSMLMMIGCTVIANLLLKSGATGMDPGIAGFISRLFSWRVLLGLGFLAVSAMLYLLILSWLPLNVAQSFAAAQFIAVILASAFVLAEPVSGAQWAGMILIAAGITVVGVTR